MLCCMGRTTIRLEDELLRAAKVHAARTGQTLTAVIANALRRELSPPVREAAFPPPLLTFPGSGTLPGVDLDDTASLLDVLDGR
jgi:hypothetical protein